MIQHLTIAYMTCRKDPKIEWFFDSLIRESGGDFTGIKVVVIDFHAKVSSLEKLAYEPMIGGGALKQTFCFYRFNPKNSVWQGDHRLTKENWFAASNARSTALCHAPDGWIAYVDDLSVLMPGWLNSVRQAMEENYIVLGAYKKVKKLVVENGEVKSFEEYPQGVDSRWNSGKDGEPVVAAGSWLFGCSLAAPVEAFLKINGWPEALCDGLGFEDCITGIVLQNAGYRFKYDRRMLTLESEEHHHLDPAFKRSDYGVSPNDKSHAVLNQAYSLKNFSNDLGEGFPDIRTLRNHVLSGGEFPIRHNPRHEWWSKTPLKDL